MSTLINLPKYTLLEKNNLGAICDGCGRDIKHVYKLRNNETGEIGEFGSGCAKNFMHGKTITEVVEEAISYKRALAEEDRVNNGAIRVQEFKEINSEMMDYINDNIDFSFLASMKEHIEKNGSLTEAQFDVVYGMMLEVAELEPKVKDLELEVFRVKVAHNDFGTNYTLLGETEDHKLVRVYFSSISLKNEEILINKEILRVVHSDYVFRASTEFKRKITVQGSFDGYKLKRVKLS